MKPLAELLNHDEPAWPLVQTWLRDATQTCEILPKDEARAAQELIAAQVTTRSPMGAVIYESGGILIEQGWLRILGSGAPRLNRGLMSWNRGKSYTRDGEAPGFLLIADDILGGYFAINGGAFGADSLGSVHYLAPDALEWENLDSNYSRFLNWALGGNIALFYETFRWPGWQEDIRRADGNEVYSFMPFLWTKEGHNIAQTSKRLVPIAEHYAWTQDCRRQLIPRA